MKKEELFAAIKELTRKRDNLLIDFELYEDIECQEYQDIQEEFNAVCDELSTLVDLAEKIG